MKYFAYSQKAFVYKYVVMLSDVDQFKHMSFANYLKLMFLATDALFVSCLDETFLNSKRLQLLQSKMQFKKQTISGDNILIKVNASSLIETGFSLLYTFVIEESGELVGLGKQIYGIVSLDRNEQVLISENPNIKNVLEPILINEETLLYQY